MMRDGHDVSWAMEALMDKARRQGNGFVWAFARRILHRGESPIKRVKTVRMAYTNGVRR